MSEYPEHQKQAQFLDASQSIGDFLYESGYTLAEYVKFDDREQEQFGPVSKRVERILADYFQIDLKKIEVERRQMIAAMQAMNEES